MHNKKKLLISWMIGLLSFMFILNGSAFAANSYLEPVDIPAYNAADSSHRLITPALQNLSDVNDLRWQHFYIEPGVYNGAKGADTYLSITTSGTASERRTLSLYDPANPTDNTHPASLADNKQADIWIRFSGASYWTIDRMANLDRGIDKTMGFYNGTNHIIISRWHARQFKYAILISDGCSYNTIQNSYLNGAEYESMTVRDSIGIALHDGGDNIATIIDTKLINNDIRNTTDAIQLVARGDSPKVNYEGTIIDSNRLWIDGEAYSNKEGVQDPNGEYMVAENCLDLKSGSTNPDNPVLITNNMLWGMRTQNDYLYTGGNNYGRIVSVHNEVYNVHMNNNIFFDTQTAVVMISAQNWEFKNNIIYNTNAVDPLNQNAVALYNSYSDGVDFSNNTIIDNHSTGYSLYLYSKLPENNAKNYVLNNNVYINSNRVGGGEISNSYDNNWLYNSTETQSGTNEQQMDSIDPKMGDYSFEYERFTVSPKTKTLYGVIATEASPHYGKAGSSISKDTLPITEPPATEETGGHWVINSDTKKLIKVQN